MSSSLSGTTALVTGASRGFGRAIAAALSEAGVNVVGVARDGARLEEVRSQLGETFTPVAADVTDPAVAGLLIDRHEPRTLVLNAGVGPLARPLQHHTWQSFTRAWDVDVKQVFHWTREALLYPLAPGSVVIAFSSAAALGGSPLTGGYAGAKVTVDFIAKYGAIESERAGLGIRFKAVMPSLTTDTELGADAVRAYARHHGVDVATHVAGMGPLLTAEQVGEAVVDLATDSTLSHGTYRITAGGLTPVV